MRFSDLFDAYINDRFKASGEVARAVEWFKSKIPANILQMEFDTSRSNKQGIKDGNKVYKLGLDLSTSTAFIEYLENYNQGQPTMAIYVDKAKSHITINGWQANKKMFMRFYIENGVVKKSVQTDR